MTTTRRLKAQGITGGPELTICGGGSTYVTEAAAWLLTLPGRL